MSNSYNEKTTTGTPARASRRTNRGRWKHLVTAKRREEAEARQVEYDKKTPQQKIDALDALFGVGLGAAKERARLANKL